MKNLKYIGLFLLIAIVLAGLYIYPKYQRGLVVAKALDQKNIAYTFLHADEFFPNKEVIAANEAHIYPKGESISLPKSFSYQGREFETASYLDSTGSQGLVVIQDDSLVFEQYYHGQEAATRHISWSVAKSFISALFGIAIEEGHIKSIEQKVDEYLPELKGSGYEGIRIKDVLQMATGVKFNEDYADPESDINRWFRAFALGESQDEFAATLVNEKEPGTINHYVSINTHVLGMIIVKATGKSLTEYLQEKIWSKIGMEHNAFWLIDNKDMEMALGGLNASLRDYAKLGSLFLHEGNWKGEQIVPKAWVQASTSPDGEHVMPDNSPGAAPNFGYGYQWWIPNGSEGEFMAIGVFHQLIYINPATRTVIAKNSANPRFLDGSNIYSNEMLSLELFRKISHAGISQ
ncbi:MAG: serine hydrolase [Bacteroidota bacterium]